MHVRIYIHIGHRQCGRTNKEKISKSIPVVCDPMLMRNLDTVDMEEKRKLEAIEMWCCRRMLKVE